MISPNEECVVSLNEIRNTRTGGVINLIDTSIPNHCHPWLSYDGRIIAWDVSNEEPKIEKTIEGMIATVVDDQ